MCKQFFRINFSGAESARQTVTCGTVDAVKGYSEPSENKDNLYFLVSLGTDFPSDVLRLHKYFCCSFPAKALRRRSVPKLLEAPGSHNTAKHTTYCPLAFLSTSPPQSLMV